MPFVARHTSFRSDPIQATYMGERDDGYGADPEAIVPLGSATDHS